MENYLMFAFFIIIFYYLKEIYKEKMLNELKQDLDQVHDNVLTAMIEDTLQHVRKKIQEEIGLVEN